MRLIADASFVKRSVAEIDCPMLLSAAAFEDGCDVSKLIVTGEDEQKVDYEVVLTQGKQKAEVVFDSSGAITSVNAR